MHNIFNLSKQTFIGMDNCYKLTYFNLRGIGEPIRMLFKYAEVSFDEVQINAGDWYEVKKGR